MSSQSPSTKPYSPSGAADRPPGLPALRVLRPAAVRALTDVRCRACVIRSGGTAWAATVFRVVPCRRWPPWMTFLECSRLSRQRDESVPGLSLSGFRAVCDRSPRAALVQWRSYRSRAMCGWVQTVGNGSWRPSRSTSELWTKEGSGHTSP